MEHKTSLYPTHWRMLYWQSNPELVRSYFPSNTRTVLPELSIVSLQKRLVRVCCDTSTSHINTEIGVMRCYKTQK